MLTSRQVHSGLWASPIFICENCLKLVLKHSQKNRSVLDQRCRKLQHTLEKPTARKLKSTPSQSLINQRVHHRRAQQSRQSTRQATSFTSESAISGSLSPKPPSALQAELSPSKLNPSSVSSTPPSPSSTTVVDLKDWELTVGIEIHAELNTKRKLFSRASTAAAPIPSSSSSTYAQAKPNTRVDHFDVALPGSQPLFQKETVIPAIRAALALHCEVQARSSFDRKHYFYHDQPCGYQITQFYEPLAKNGRVPLYAANGIAPEDGPVVHIDIERIQMEQDTAKSIQYSENQHLIDYNRASHPLIEIITAPQIHHPATAAALVKKIQAALKAVDAVTAGMEMGGLRADVNVSVRKRENEDYAKSAEVQRQQPNQEVRSRMESSEAGLLGQRTEIKNLSSLKAVYDAIVAERNRQVAILSTGDKVVGETRAWTLGEKESRKLRMKEGEVDYRYMPDADLGPLIVGKDLVDYLKETLPLLPDQLVEMLLDKRSYGIPEKDARILAASDDGDMLDYYMDVVHHVKGILCQKDVKSQKVAKLVANWTLHELGGLLGSASLPWSQNPVSSQDLASTLILLLRNEITGHSAKYILATLFRTRGISVQEIVKSENLLLQTLSREHYVQLAKSVIERHESVAESAKAEGGSPKIMFLVGQMIREGEKGRVEPPKAKSILEEVLCNSTGSG